MNRFFKPVTPSLILPDHRIVRSEDQSWSMMQGAMQQALVAGGGPTIPTWDATSNSSSSTISNAGKTLAGNGGVNSGNAISLNPFQEYSVRLGTNLTNMYVGVSNSGYNQTDPSTTPASSASALVYQVSNGRILSNGSILDIYDAASLGDLITFGGVSGAFYVKKNGVLIGSPTTTISGTLRITGAVGGVPMGSLTFE